MPKQVIPKLFSVPAAARVAGCDKRTFLKRAEFFGVRPAATICTTEGQKPLPVFDSEAIRIVVDQTRQQAEDALKQAEEGGAE